MARQTTNQSANQSTNQPTSQDQQYTPADRQQSGGAQQESRAQQASTAGGSTTAGRGDRERSLTTTRESGMSRGGSRSLSPKQGYTPAWGRGAASDPFALMQRMAEDMDRLFDQFGLGRTGLGLMPATMLGPGARGGSLLGQGQGASSLWSPQVEMYRRGESLVVRADLPGVSKDDLQVSVEDDVLTIRGERRDEREEREEGLYRSERSYGEFFRAIPLPDGTDAERCEAKYEDGVLEVTLPVPKQEERKPRRIEVR